MTGDKLFNISHFAWENVYSMFVEPVMFVEMSDPSVDRVKLRPSSCLRGGYWRCGIWQESGVRLFAMQQVEKAFTSTAAIYSVRKQATDACCVRSIQESMVDACNIVVHINLK